MSDPDLKFRESRVNSGAILFCDEKLICDR